MEEEEIKLSLTKDGKTSIEIIPANQRDAYFKIAKSKGVEVQEIPWTVKDELDKRKNYLKELDQKAKKLNEEWLNPGFFTSGKKIKENERAWRDAQSEYNIYRKNYWSNFYGNLNLQKENLGGYTTAGEEAWNSYLNQPFTNQGSSEEKRLLRIEQFKKENPGKDIPFKLLSKEEQRQITNQKTQTRKDEVKKWQENNPGKPVPDELLTPLELAARNNEKKKKKELKKKLKIKLILMKLQIK